MLALVDLFVYLYLFECVRRLRLLEEKCDRMMEGMEGKMEGIVQEECLWNNMRTSTRHQAPLLPSLEYNVNNTPLHVLPHADQHQHTCLCFSGQSTCNPIRVCCVEVTTRWLTGRAANLTVTHGYGELLPRRNRNGPFSHYGTVE